MTTAIPTEPSVIEKSADGVIVVSGTRVPIDTVVFWFNHGSTAEVIADKYPSLSLAQVYSSIAYYLNHRVEIDEYIKSAEAESLQNQKRLSANGQNSHLRSRLLARKSEVVMS